MTKETRCPLLNKHRDWCFQLKLHIAMTKSNDFKGDSHSEQQILNTQMTLLQNADTNVVSTQRTTL